MDSNNSTSALISELTTTRHHAWQMISKVKEIAGAIQKKEREELLAIVMDAERAIRGGIIGGIHA